MDVAVACVSERERGHVMALADLERLACDVAQPVERIGDVLAERAATLREDRERGAAAPPPELATSLGSVGACTATASSASASRSSPATRRASASAPSASVITMNAARGEPERIRVAGVGERDAVEVLDPAGTTPDARTRSIAEMPASASR